MPIISAFYGIAIQMYFDDSTQPHTPHFHALYGGTEAVFDLDGNVIARSFPKRQTRFVAVWADIHREELLTLWEVVQRTGDYFKIKGLD